MRKNKRFLVLAAMLLAVACAATFMVGSAVAAGILINMFG